MQIMKTKPSAACTAPRASRALGLPHLPNRGVGLRTPSTRPPVLEQEQPQNQAPRSSTVAQAAKKVLISGAAAQAASSLPAVPNAVVYAVIGATLYTALLFIGMILAPRETGVRRTMLSFWTFAPLALVYLALLAYSWSPDTISVLLPGSLAEGFSGGFNPQFFPKLDGIQELFSRPLTTASWILHILVINLFLGRSIYFDGLSSGTPTGLSLLVASVAGPVGLLLHWATKAVTSSLGMSESRTGKVLKGANGGTIIILPYEDAKP